MTESGRRPRIAHVSGPNATIQNSPPLVTSHKARRRHGLANEQAPFDVLRPQRLAAPAKIYVDQFSAHPMEADRADLYWPPDGYITADGTFTAASDDPTARPVYEIELLPSDGLYPLPYMARQSDGRAWDAECADESLGEAGARQTFYPDGSRSFEEIDRLGIGADGRGNLLAQLADFTFHRLLPPAGPVAPSRSGEGFKTTGEQRGRDFFPYSPRHLAAMPQRAMLAALTNGLQAIASDPACDAILWTQGSPQVEETAYWFNLLIDTQKPICATSAQRPHGQLSNDGPQNILDATRYIASRLWCDGAGGNRCGTVLIQEQRVFAAREVVKIDARPGGYAVAGGGILGHVDHNGRTHIEFTPVRRHTAGSLLNLSALPDEVPFGAVHKPIKDKQGRLLAEAIPLVSIIKDGAFSSLGMEPADEHDLKASIAHKIDQGLLAGFILEGLVPYGHNPSTTRNALLLEAAFSGLTICRVGRGLPDGYADLHPYMAAGANLNAIKARLLLMAALMRFGAPPRAADPSRPTAGERQAVAAHVAALQTVFDTH